MSFDAGPENDRPSVNNTNTPSRDALGGSRDALEGSRDAGLPVVYKMRCPGCQKLYSVQARIVQAAGQPLQFQCLSCETRFAIPLLEQSALMSELVETIELERLPGSYIERARSAAEKAPVGAVELRCPKCRAKNSMNATECRTCGVIFAKYDPSRSLPFKSFGTESNASGARESGGASAGSGLGKGFSARAWSGATSTSIRFSSSTDSATGAAPNSVHGATSGEVLGTAPFGSSVASGSASSSASGSASSSASGSASSSASGSASSSVSGSVANGNLLAFPTTQTPSQLTDVSLAGRRDLAELWTRVMENYENEELHEKFISECYAAGCLPFASQKYARILSAAPAEEIARDMRDRIIGLVSFRAEVASDRALWNVRIPGINSFVIALGGACVTMGLMLPNMKVVALIGVVAIALGIAIRTFLRQKF